MTLLAQLTVATLWVPLAITPPGLAPLAQLQVMAPESAPPPAAAPAAAAPPAAVEPSPMAPAAVAPTGTTVVVPEGTATTVVASAPIESVSTTTTTPTGTTTTTVTTSAPPPAPAVSPKAAVKTLLRYDPYLAPRYRSGRNMMIGGGVMLGVGTFTLLTTLFWAAESREDVNEASGDERRRLARNRNNSLLTAQVVGAVGASVAVTGVVLLAVGAVRKRRAIEEARGRVFMQGGPGGIQVRF
jgi:hypothetical protein